MCWKECARDQCIITSIFLIFQIWSQCKFAKVIFHFEWKTYSRDLVLRYIKLIYLYKAKVIQIRMFYAQLALFSPRTNCMYKFCFVFNEGTNILCGIGILTIPYAIKEGGWLSLLLLLMFSIICCYTGILLMRCLQSHPGLNTYPDIGQAAFGIAGRLGIAVSIVQYAFKLIITCIGKYTQQFLWACVILWI